MKQILPRTLLGAMLLPLLLWAQAGSPKITAVEPETGKTGATLTLNGENLGKDSVEAFYFSDDAQDFPAEVAEQSATKVVVKIPSLKAGPYNISVKVGDNIFIQPTRVTIE